MHDQGTLVQRFGRTPRLSGGTAEQSGTFDPAIAEMLPRPLGRFRLLRRIGEPSGQGAVYEAVDGDGRHFAVKVLPEGARRRFEREAAAALRMDHPNVVRVFGAGRTAGQNYLAMELLHGRSLLSLVCGAGRLAPATAADLGRQAALGLAAVHAGGLAHRDVKPANLLLTDAGVVKVLDLGLVSALPGGEPLTPAGARLGTVDYMAPEQIRGYLPADGRADQYGLGATLYHLLAGVPPFARRGTVGEKLAAHVAEPPPPLRDANPLVPEALAATVARLLAKRPDERFPSMAAVAAALGATAILADGQPS